MKSVASPACLILGAQSTSSRCNTMLQNITQIQESALRDRCPCSTNPPLFSSPWVARRPGHPDLLGGRTLLGGERGGVGRGGLRGSVGSALRVCRRRQRPL